MIEKNLLMYFQCGAKQPFVIYADIAWKIRLRIIKIPHFFGSGANYYYLLVT